MAKQRTRSQGKTNPNKRIKHHGRVTTSSNRSETQISLGALSAEIQRPRVTTFQYLTVVPQFSGQSDFGPKGAPGQYRVIFVLGVPGLSSVADSLNVSDLVSSGDSLLLSNPRLDIVLGIEEFGVEAQFSSNASGRLSHVVVELDADSFADAAAKAHDFVLPALSRLAFEADTPLEVKATLIVEMNTGSMQLGTVVVGQFRQMPLIPGRSTVEQRALLASYREGINSTAPLYQVLCFHKVIEGSRGFFIHRLRTAKREFANSPNDPLTTRFPADLSNVPDVLPWERTLLQPFLGQTFAEIDEAIGKTMRDAVAHITPGTSHRVADYLGDIEACRAIVPVLRLVARQLIRDELNYQESIST